MKDISNWFLKLLLPGFQDRFLSAEDDSFEAIAYDLIFCSSYLVESILKLYVMRIWISALDSQLGKFLVLTLEFLWSR